MDAEQRQTGGDRRAKALEEIERRSLAMVAGMGFHYERRPITPHRPDHRDA